MIRLRQLRWARATVAVIYMVIAALVGFLHKPEVFAASPNLEQFRLSDGSLPIICKSGGENEHGQGDHLATRSVCDACRLTEQPGLGAVAPPVQTHFLEEVSQFATLGSKDICASPAIRLAARGPPALQF